MTTQIRAAIYSRVSSEAQAEEDKTSLAEQVSAMEGYAAERGYSVVSRYEDIASGVKRDRPGFQRLQADARAGVFDVVLAWKADRLARSGSAMGDLLDAVEPRRVNVETVRETFDMKLAELLASVARMERQSIVERTMLGKKGAAKLGRIPVGKPPFGYRRNSGGYPAVVEAEAEMVRRMFSLYVDGKGVPEVRRILEREYPYVPALSNLYGWLRPSAYVGRLMYKGIEVPTPPIVDQDTWDRAQTQLDRQRANPRNTRRTYTLAGLLTCEGCGSRVRGHARGHLTYYRCRNHAPSCRPRPYVRADELEGQVWREVTDVLMNPDLLVRRFMDNCDDTLAEDVRHAEREVTKWTTRNERLITLFVSGDITKAEFDRQRKFVTEPLEDAQQRLDDVRERQNQQSAQQNLGGLFEAYWQAMFMYSPTS